MVPLDMALPGAKDPGLRHVVSHASRAIRARPDRPVPTRARRQWGQDLLLGHTLQLRGKEGMGPRREWGQD